jgi:UDP-N-acetylmuramate dehydrogenase
MFDLLKKSELLKMLPEVRGKYLPHEPLRKYTWFGVGGPAEVMFVPEDDADLECFLQHKTCQFPVFVLGSGSNLLVRDGGIPGVVIRLNSRFYKQWNLNGTELTCGAGLKNSELKKIMLDNGLGGLEFLVSIPGSLGGAVKTNAGCFGKELKDVLVKATVVDGEGVALEVPAADFHLEYRNSHFPEDWIVTSLTLKAEPQEPEITAQKIEEQKAYRLKSQPHNVKTAGSTFKNPEGLRAWELIKKSGCASLHVNGAAVSDVHCNFLVNTGSATAQDIENLGNMIVENVKKQTSIELEWEVKRVGVAR